MDTTSLHSDFTLEPGTARTLPREARGATLTVVRGRIWLTEDERLGDHFIVAGGQYRLPRRGPVVIECDSPEPARLRLSKAAPAGKPAAPALAAACETRRTITA
jgi:hypothetical protein